MTINRLEVFSQLGKYVWNTNIRDKRNISISGSKKEWGQWTNSNIIDKSLTFIKETILFTNFTDNGDFKS